jgi:hypothetical protein
MSIRSAETVSSGEEGEATEYPASSSQRSTLESRPEMLSCGKGVELRNLDVTIDTDDDDLSQVTIATARETGQVGGSQS